MSITVLFFCAFIGQGIQSHEVAIVSHTQVLTLLEQGVERQYFFISENLPLKIAVYGPGLLKVDVRKVIVMGNKDNTQLPVILALYMDNNPIKRYKIVPQESMAASFLHAGTISPSEPNIIEIAVPQGKHTYLFHILPPSLGGGALYFFDREIVTEKELDARQTAKKSEGPQKSFVERFAVEEEVRKERNYGLGLRLGYILGTDYISTMFFGGDLSFVLPVLRRSLSLVLEGGYYSQDKKEAFNGTPLSWTLQVIPVTLNARYTYPFASPILPYAGAGAGYFISTLNYGTDGGQKVTKQGSAPGFQGFIGAEFGAGIGEAFLEARIFGSNFTNNDVGIKGGVGQYSVSLGWRFLY